MVIEVNFTDDEANSTAPVPLPSGEYVCAITEAKMGEVKKDGKNKGKPFWNLELTVQEGKYQNRKMWSTVMLFDGALYSLAQLMKAIGLTPGTSPVPDIGDLEGKRMICVGQKVRDEYREKKEGSDEPMYKLDVKGYKPIDGAVTSSGNSVASKPTGSASNLP